MQKKVACLTAVMSQVQRDLGKYGLKMDVDAFWAQFTQRYNRVTASLRRHARFEETDDMDPESMRLLDELTAWLQGF